MTDLGNVYAAARKRVTELTVGLTPEEAARVVPACPEWTVKDVLAHVAGVCDDVLTGNIEGVASDPWTAAQVEKRKAVPVEGVLAEWADKAAQVEPLVEFFPGRVGEQFVLDMTTHEHDLRHALGAPGARESDGVDVGVKFMVEVGFLANVALRGLPPLEVVAGEHRWVTQERPAAEDVDTAIQEAAEAVLTGVTGPLLGDAGASAAGSLKVSAFELMRALSGRRSLEEIRGFGWTVDPEPYLRAFQFGPFTTRPDALSE
ncbi:MAG TPA: maleylpyruvate isomerase family mycothiol-dependent enzyme [Acidimicrobiales bacterium]|jgi:uncharacterized protein (TIGR03083 family)|nr:maleylpyruvate isomerase family mycothiol-dependent enzyme [Acidimicrobiales bacterium]